MPLIRLQGASLAFGHIPLLDGVGLVVENTERLCLVGRNGTGKSTLLNVLVGDQVLDSGSVWRGDGVKIAKLAQEVPEAQASTLFDVVAVGLGDHSDLLSRYHRLSNQLADASAAQLAEFAGLQEEVEQAGIWQGSQSVDAVLSRLNLDPDALMSESSGGIRRRAMLGRAMVSEPDLLLLDEPTNHLDIDSIAALEDALFGYRGAVLFITHDRTFIDQLATRIVELDRGKLTSYPGDYAAYLARKSADLAVEARTERKFDKELAAEEVWIRQGIKARRTRNEGRVRKLEGLREQRAQRLNRQGKAKLALDSDSRSGKLVLEAQDLAFGYDNDELFQPFSLEIMRGDRIGIIGPNGCGKTTLIKLLLGEIKPTTGSVKLGTSLQVAYFDQERDQLDPEKSVRENVGEGSDQIEVGGKTRHVISYLGDFLFPPARVHSPVKSLSGGERNRLLLAKLFTKPANLLILDEPTNDLDVETLELLEELLGEYQGTLLLVSHDRSFLDRTVTSTLAIDSRGVVEEQVGGYSDWVNYRQSQLTARAEQAKSEQVKQKQTSPKQTASKKLKYKDQRELKLLPEKIERLEQELGRLNAQTGTAEFYKRDQALVAQAMQDIATKEVELQQAYDRWAELES